MDLVDTGLFLSPFQGWANFSGLDPVVSHSAALRAPPLATLCRAAGAIEQ